MNSPLLEKYMDFSTKVVLFYEDLLKRTNLIAYDFDNLLSLAEEIKRMLIASLNTAKENRQ